MRWPVESLATGPAPLAHVFSPALSATGPSPRMQWPAVPMKRSPAGVANRKLRVHRPISL